MENGRFQARFKEKVKRKIVALWKRPAAKKAAVILSASVFLAAVVYREDSKTGLPVTEDGTPYLERNDPGTGERKEKLIAETEGSGEIEIDVKVAAQTYSKKQQRELLRKAAEQLESLILGDNKSLDKVSSDLTLIRKIPDTDIEVEWEIEKTQDGNQVIDSGGRIKTENIPKEGCILELTAILTIEEEQLLQSFPVSVLSAAEGGENSEEQLSKNVKEEAAAKREEKQVLLPEKQNGKTVTWRYNKENRGPLLLLLGTAVAGMMFWQERKQKEKEEKKKKKQMLLDYPEIVNKFTIYTGAGLTIRRAWEKIVMEYEKSEKLEMKRYAYEEMKLSWRELESGIGEQECYEHFGERCRLQPYLKLGALLSQNLRKGTKGLSELLRAETDLAFEERKAAALRMGEEAGTKLLLPMFLMLSVVLLIVIVPAFLSIQL